MRNTLLFADSRLKQEKYHQRLQREQQLIHSMANCSKVTQGSMSLLSMKMLTLLESIQTPQITLQASIPILSKLGILRALGSLDEAKRKLSEQHGQSERVRHEARFIYCLWDVLGGEVTNVDFFKESILILDRERDTKNLKQTLLQLCETWQQSLPNGGLKSQHQRKQTEESIKKLVASWCVLRQDQQFYKATINQLQTMFCSVPSNERFKDENSFSSSSKGLSFHHQSTPLKPSRKANRQNSQSRLERSTSNATLPFKQRNLVERLYNQDSYKQRQELKKAKEVEQMCKQMKNCTFHPETNAKRQRSISTDKRNVKGFEKAVSRIKVGADRLLNRRQLEAHIPSGQNYYKNLELEFRPPGLLSRPKLQDQVLFIIQFELGRHRIKVKIRPGDSGQSVADNLCKIYSLKDSYHEHISRIVKDELEAFYRGEN